MKRPKWVNDACREYRKTHPTCEICGCKENATTHHIVALSIGGSSEDINFMTWCREHHDKVESGEIWVGVIVADVQ